MEEVYERIYSLVREIPRGRVTTYGQLTAMVGISDSRVVGDAMKASEGLPWQRVINSRGEISIKGATGARQRALLEEEGITFDNGRINLARFGWLPDPGWLQAHDFRVPPPFPAGKQDQSESGEQLNLF